MDAFAGIRIPHHAEVQRYDDHVDAHHEYVALPYHHHEPLLHRVDDGPW